MDDPWTVRLRFDSPAPQFKVMPGADLPILPKHIWEGVTDPKTMSTGLPVGTGPALRLAVGRPRVPWEGQRRTVLHPLEFTAVLSAARRHSDTAHALVALLGMLGLRVSEACAVQIADLRYAGGYELLRVMGKGSNPRRSRCRSLFFVRLGLSWMVEPADRSCCPAQVDR